MNATLAGRSAVVTGAASGIGRAIAMALSREGCSLCLIDRAPLERTTAVVQAIAAGGGNAIAVQADVADEAQVVAAVARAASQFGQLDIVVNNAGILIEKPLLETTTGDFDAVIGVNLKGAFLVGREVLRHMVKARSGRVINIASELAYLGRANSSIYCASKGGIISMTRSWAREFAPGILVNAIAPGPTDTPMLEADFDPAGYAGQGNRDPPRPHCSAGRDRQRGRVSRRPRRHFHHGAMHQPKWWRGHVLSKIATKSRR